MSNNARRWTVDSDEYHATHDVYGRSMLDTYRDSPMLFHGRFVTHEIPQRKAGKPLVFGSNFDRMFLEREKVVEIPADVLSKVGSKAGGKWKEWKAVHAGRLILKASEFDIFCRMEENIRSHKDASQLIQGQEQVAIRWTDPETGLPLKARLDILGDGRCVDLKTSADPTPRAFAMSIEKFGYYRQAAMYTWGMEQLIDRDHEWFFVVIRNVAPWDVWTYQITTEWIVRGLDEIRETLRLLKASIENDVWLPPGYGQTHELQPPKYTEYEDHYQIGETE